MDKQNENLKRQNLRLLMHRLYETHNPDSTLYSIEVLEPIKGLELTRDEQDFILSHIPAYLSDINPISLDAIHHFFKILSQKWIFQTQAVEKILFECYNNHIDFFNDLTDEEKINLTFTIIKRINYKNVLNINDPEALMVYDKLIEISQSFSDNQKKEILSSNPEFIKNIDNQTEELQIFALDNYNYTGLILLKDFKNPSNKVYARLLRDFHSSANGFNGIFKDGVPDEIIDMTLPQVKYFSNIFKYDYYFGKKLSDKHLDYILSKDPSCLAYLTYDQLTVERILNAIELKPAVLKILKNNFRIYSMLYADYAQEVMVLPELKTDENLTAMKEYSMFVDGVIKNYHAITKLDSELAIDPVMLARTR